MDSWFHLPRRPEPELMDSEEEVEAYSSAAAQKYLAKIDRSFVGHVEKLFRGASVAGTALDLGCGPGQIPIMMAGRWPALRITGLDASPRMIDQARRNASHASVPIAFQVFRFSGQSSPKTGSGRLPFADRCFDLVTCNSVLHHLSDPLAALDEIARVARPSAAILIRDLRRPSAPALQLHLAFFSRHYSGEMCRLYRDSVRAAYTASELNELLEKSALNSAGIRPPKVFHHGFTHIGIARPFRAE